MDRDSANVNCTSPPNPPMNHLHSAATDIPFISVWEECRKKGKILDNLGLNTRSLE
jgi:hypothetical protein